MVSSKMLSGKHPLTVRVSDEDYKVIKKAAFEMDMTPNEFIALSSAKEAQRIKEQTETKE